MGGAFGLITRLPAVVFVVLLLLVVGKLMENHVFTPDQAGVFLGAPVANDIQLVVALAPELIALAALLAVVFWLFHHHVYSGMSALSAGGLLVLDLIWHFTAFGTWATTHLSGTG